MPLRKPAAPVDRPPAAVLAAAFLFNLGQGVLRPALPLFLQQAFAANYRMVTAIPVVFGAGKWIANLPAGYLLDRIGRARLMAAGLTIVAVSDVVSTLVPTYLEFLAVRGGAGTGWAMFTTVATSMMIAGRQVNRRGRAVSVLLTMETAGLLVGTAAGGWLFDRVGTTSPFFVEAGCMLIAAAVISRAPLAASGPPPVARETSRTVAVLRVPGFVTIALVNAALTAIQTGALVFLLPLYLAARGLRPDAVGYCLALTVLGRLATLWLGGSLSDRYGRLRLLIAGLLAYAVVLATLTLIHSPWWLGVSSFAIGAGSGFVASLPTAIVGDRVDSDARGVAIGWLRTATDAGMLIGPLTMGPLADAISLDAPFLAAAVVLVPLAWSCRRLHVRVTSSPAPPSVL